MVVHLYMVIWNMKMKNKIHLLFGKILQKIFNQMKILIIMEILVLIHVSILLREVV